MKYTIEHHFTYGWDILNEEDVYPTQAEAQKAIDDLIEAVQEAFEQGDMSDPYDPADFCVGEYKMEGKE